MPRVQAPPDQPTITPNDMVIIGYAVTAATVLALVMWFALRAWLRQRRAARKDHA